MDLLPTEDLLRLINREDQRVTEAIRIVLPAISKAVDLIAERMKQGGRLIYIGAGTSGRLGVLDAVECTPTFSLEPGRVIGIIAGGKEAMFEAQEAVEDNFQLGASEIARYKVDKMDSVVGIAASGKPLTSWAHWMKRKTRRPFDHGLLQRRNTVGTETGRGDQSGGRTRSTDWFDPDESGDCPKDGFKYDLDGRDG